MIEVSRKWFFILAVLTVSILSAGCGSQQEKPEETQKVMKISITPIPSPTLEPERINQDAIVRNGTITMINEYTIYPSDETEEDIVADLQETDTESQDETE